MVAALRQSADTSRLPATPKVPGMLRQGPQSHPDTLALEANAACAGLALACAYSSSDEYEAEIIQARRAAGVYGSRNHHQAYAALAAAAVACVFALLII
jgi:hypothetical protein